MGNRKNIGIIGVGPRGLSALEKLCEALAYNKAEQWPYIMLFETTSLPGSGQVWDTGQSNVNWLNISQRALHDLKGRKKIVIDDLEIPSFLSYIDWLPADKKNDDEDAPDLFPPRSQMGIYLSERFRSIAEPLIKDDHLKLIKELIERVEYEKDKFNVFGKSGNHFQFDEIVLTIGHQPTQLSDQLQRWKDHSDNCNETALFLNPYPIEKIIRSKKIDHNTNVGIRGFGLAMIDVLRALTIGKGGSFEILNGRTFKSKFIRSEDVPGKIIPFSLDGNPIVPKPLNGALDKAYTPTSHEMQIFKIEIEKYTGGIKKADNIKFLIKAMASIAAKQYISLKSNALYEFEGEKEAGKIIESWLNDDGFKHKAIYPLGNAPDKAIEDYIKMAVNGEKITLDYCVGQVWRHCQPCMYKLFSHARLEDDVLTDVVKIDERMKRYAYGPPVESMQQVLALHEADILKFDFSDDPDIELTDEGWELTSNNKNITVSCMINSVLAAPKLMEVTSPIITNLLADDLLRPVHSDLGIKTKPDGCIVLPDENDKIPLAILGRLCKGSVLGVDAILECFRLRIDDWAKGAVMRLNNHS